jgi:hypothetical protein
VVVPRSSFVYLGLLCLVLKLDLAVSFMEVSVVSMEVVIEDRIKKGAILRK